MKFLFPSSLLVAIAGTASAFLANIAGPGFTQQQKSLTGGAFFNHNHIAYRPHLYMSEKESDTAIVEAEFEKLSNEEKKQAVGNLVANDEWNGLSMELSEIIRMAVMEDIKSKTADFIGKENYSVGDISKEIDGRVKQEIANLRGKEDYELGDAIVVLDNMSKSMVEEMTGKEYETGDLSKTLDKKIKDAVAVWAGKEVGQYEFGDLSKAMDTRIKARVEEFTGAGEYKVHLHGLVESSLILHQSPCHL